MGLTVCISYGRMPSKINCTLVWKSGLALLLALCFTLTCLALSSSQLFKPSYVQLLDSPHRLSPQQLQHNQQGTCDLSKGRWELDSRGPLYTNDSCPILTQAQNCQGNGRPDREYQFWRWTPRDCHLPRFHPAAFLQLMRGKTLAFVGDSVTRNQMESLICMLMQVEKPMNHGDKNIRKWHFRESSVTVVRIWSSWLVQQSLVDFPHVPPDAAKLQLQQVDEALLEYLPKVDVLVVSSGHWFTKKTAFIIGGRVVGSQGWRYDPPGIDNFGAFSISMKAVLTALATVPGYAGLSVLRTYSPDHYEGGTWNRGGTCSKRTKPLQEHELVENKVGSLMYQLQRDAFLQARRNVSNGSKLRLLDIYPVSTYRADGHPSRYRSKDSVKLKTPAEDCLHWCMPGPIDTWNELLFQILKEEFA